MKSLQFILSLASLVLMPCVSAAPTEALAVTELEGTTRMLTTRKPVAPCRYSLDPVCPFMLRGDCVQDSGKRMFTDISLRYCLRNVNGDLIKEKW
ncbi:hypothetical protein O9K51_05327 [Purpureocillium lavendulum]|uniref:Uncharacterized protein n=1 Tax=Purpureocillium lavendulum TaxID=1247861 RepID=A0AB34FTR7_9HYPO|nr:hypothetical protein O9K51_05327 [Purpureocillium lavendulum]